MNQSGQCLNDEEVLRAACDASLDNAANQHLDSCKKCRERIARRQRGREEVLNLIDQGTSLDDWLTNSTCGIYECAPEVTETRSKHVQEKNSQCVNDGRRFQSGDSIGKYRVVRLLGSGGQSEAYLIQDTDMDLDVSLFVAKVCRRARSTGERIRDSEFQYHMDALHQEANILAKLAGCSGIVQYQYSARQDFGLGIEEPYLVIEYVHGLTLRQCKQRVAGSRPQAIQLLLEFCHIVARAHERGVVHGDLKPDNIVIKDDGQIRIIDFGMARVRNLWSQGYGEQHRGATPRYMAPEQTQHDESLVSPATDVFALGAILQEVLTNDPVYRGSHFEAVLRQAQLGEISVASLEQVGDRELHAILKKALQADPALRYESAAELAAALGSLHLGSVGGRPAQNWTRRSWLRLTIAAAILAPVGWLAWQILWPANPQQIRGLLRVARGTQEVTIERHVPLRLGQHIRIESTGAANLEWLLVWVDSKGNVDAFHKDSTGFPLLITAQESGEIVSIEWGGKPQWPILTGQGGTEMVVLLGLDDGRATIQTKMISQIAAIVQSPDAWPLPTDRIPDDMVIRFTRSQTQFVQGAGQGRGITSGDAPPLIKVEQTIRAIQHGLSSNAAIVHGEVFPVAL